MPASRSKYFSRKFTDAEGIRWDSQKEYQRYHYLLRQQQLGHITDLRRQVYYTLIGKQTITLQRTGRRGQPLKPKQKLLEKEVGYFADFVYRLPDGTQVVEDVKSPITRTPDYKIKRKMMLYFHHIQIHEVESSSAPIPPTTNENPPSLDPPLPNGT